MDSRKPLTAGVEELIERIETALALHNEGGPLASTPMKIPAGAYRALVDAKRLLSPPTPPPDAAVREAVEAAERYAMPNIAFQELISTPHLSSKHLRTLLRAVQAPRLTPEQAIRLREAADTLEAHGEALEAQWLRAALPEVFAGEVGRG